MDEKTLARFWPKVNKAGPVPEHVPELGPCWVWTASINHEGYGQLSVGGRAGRPFRAHRLAWEHEFGETSLFVLHKCDNRRCVRPAHLFAGTNLDNARDCAAKGRNVMQTNPECAARGARHGSHTHPDRVARGVRHGSRTCPGRLPTGAAHHAIARPEVVARGERQGLAKATEKTVREMRHMAARGVMLRAIGAAFGLSKSCVHSIVTRKTWRHVE